MSHMPLEAAAPPSEPVIAQAPISAKPGSGFGDHLRRARSTSAPGSEKGESDPVALKSTRRKASRDRKKVEMPAQTGSDIGHIAVIDLSKSKAVKIDARQLGIPDTALVEPVEDSEFGKTAAVEHEIDSLITSVAPIEAVVTQYVESIAEQSLHARPSETGIDSLSKPLDELLVESPVIIDRIPEGEMGAVIQIANYPQTINALPPDHSEPSAIGATNEYSPAREARAAGAATLVSVVAAEALLNLDAATESTAVDTIEAAPPPVDGEPSTEQSPASANAAEPPRARAASAGVAAPESSGRTGVPRDPQLEVDRVRFVQRVSRAFQSLGDGEGQIRLRLSPPSLGALTLEVAVRGGEMVARMETETAAAKNLLLDSLPALRERLSQHEVRIARFDIDLANHNGGGRGGEHTFPDARPQANSLHRHDEPATTSPTSTRRPLPSATQTNLDVII